MSMLSIGSKSPYITKAPEQPDPPTPLQWILLCLIVLPLPPLEPLFYGFFSGAYGIQTYLWDATYNLSVWHRTFLSSPLGYYILVGGVAIAAGIAVFTALQLLGVAGKEGREALGERNAYRREALQRLSQRALGLVGWTLYMAFFFSTFLLFVSLLNELGVDMVNRGEQSGILRCVASAAALMIAIPYPRGLRSPGGSAPPAVRRDQRHRTH